MASRFVEADEEFIGELRNTTENKNTKGSTERRVEKMSNLEATKYHSLTKPSIILPFMWQTSNPKCPQAIKD